MNEKENLKKMEKAAAMGTLKGKILSNLLSPLLTVLVIMVALAYITNVVIPNMQKDFDAKIDSLVSFEDPADSHDLVLEDHSILGYTAADFEDAIIKSANQKAELEVYEVTLNDVVKLTDTGLFNWAALTKTQIITFKGIATYTVDLSKISTKDISVDNDAKSVTLQIPHAMLKEDINIPAEDMEIGEVINGILTWGEIKQSAEDFKKIQVVAKQKMLGTLVQNLTYVQADRFAKLSIGEIYGPIVKKIAPGYTLVVEFSSEF